MLLAAQTKLEMVGFWINDRFVLREKVCTNQSTLITLFKGTFERRL
jgi:hypothetical protein